MIENFYKGGKMNANGGLLNTRQTEVFNAYGGSGELVNTKPSGGFRNAAGRKYGMYGADGSASTTDVVLAVPTATNTIGLNMPTLLVLALGFAVGYFFKQEAGSIGAAI